MNNRRKLLMALGAGALAAPLACFAQQQPAKTARIGYLGATSAAGYARQVDALRAGLRELGYVEGKNLVIEFRWAEGELDRLPGLAAELVRLKLDIIVTSGGPGSRAAKAATATIPIVLGAGPDPVATGMVASLARPGGNITGLSFFVLELNAKRLELLKEAFPRIRRVAVLLNSGNAGNSTALQAMEAAAMSLKLELQPFAVRSPIEFEGAFAEMSKRRVEAVLIYDDAMLVANAAAAARLATKHRIPAIGFLEVAEGGGLMAYGVDFPALFRRAATYVDKILKGANPGELPVERATRFEVVVNLKTAKALGIRIPQSVLIRAERVIE